MLAGAHIRGRGARGAAAVVLAAGVAACDRDDEAAVRAAMAAWFYLGETKYFESRRRCTVAVFAVTVDQPRPELPVLTDAAAAMAAMRAEGLAAIRIEGYSPSDMTDTMLLQGDGAFGQQALGSAALAGDCLGTGPARQMLYEALTREGATLAYDAQARALIVLDQQAFRLIYVEGEAW